MKILCVNWPAYWLCALHITYAIIFTDSSPFEIWTSILDWHWKQEMQVSHHSFLPLKKYNCECVNHKKYLPHPSSPYAISGRPMALADTPPKLMSIAPPVAANFMSVPIIVFSSSVKALFESTEKSKPRLPSLQKESYKTTTGIRILTDNRY